MIDVLVTVCAIWQLVFGALVFLAYPSLIGKPKSGFYTAKDYVTLVVLVVMPWVVVAGHVLGWW